MIEKLTARPSGPSDSELRLQAELAETRRRQEESDRRMEEQRREELRRQELRDMEVKFQATIRELREMNVNKQDPMLPMLMTLITQQQASAMEAVKAIQAATANGTAAAERSQQQMMAQLQSSIMSPIQLMQLLQSAKGDAAEGSKAIIESAKEAMALQKDVFTQLLEVSGQGGQPWYASAIQGALDRAAQITAALAERSQAQAQQTQQIQQQQMQQPQPQPQPRRQQVAARQQNPIQPQMASMQGVPAAVQPAVSDARPEGARYDKATDEIVLLDGRRFPQAYVQREGWRHALTMPTALVEQEIMELKAAGGVPSVGGLNGVPTGAAVPSPAAPTVPSPAAPTVPSPAAPTGKKPRGKKPRSGEQTPEQIAEMITKMTDADPKAVFDVLSTVEDKELFGSLLFPYVENLRTTLPQPADVAKYVLQARGQVQGFGGTVPIAIALLDAGQIQVLVERLVPDAPPTYQDACVAAIGDALEAEDAGSAKEEPEEV
jgi:hypothetical protein